MKLVTRPCTIPRATYIAVGFIALFYAFSVWIVVQAFGSEGVLAAAGADPADRYAPSLSTPPRC
jgi:hypothetical protein